MTIIAASFFWQNDKPGGIGLTFGPPTFTPSEIEAMFNGDILKDFLRHSDEALGTNVVSDYLNQLQVIGRVKKPTIQMALMAALNIIWLVDRGFMPKDEFNGYQFVKVL